MASLSDSHKSSDTRWSDTLSEIVFNILNSPYYVEPECIQMYSRHTSTLEKGKLLQLFYEVVMKVLPMLSATCYGSEKIAIRVHEFDTSTINDFKAIFSLSDADVTLIELVQEVLFKYTRMYPCCSVLHFFVATEETVFVRILANSEDEKVSVLRKIQSIVERVTGSSEGNDFILSHFTCMVATIDEKCVDYGQIKIFYPKEVREVPSEMLTMIDNDRAPNHFEPSELTDKDFRQPPSPFMKSDDVSSISSSISGCLHTVGGVSNGKDNSSTYEINEENIGVHSMWPKAMTLKDQQMKVFAAFYNPQQLLTDDKNSFYANNKQFRQCVSNVSAISLIKIAPNGGPMVESVQVLTINGTALPLPSIPHHSEYRGIVTCKLPGGETTEIEIIGQAHRCHLAVNSRSDCVYDVFYVGNLKRGEKEFAGFDSSCSGAPCCMASDGRLHSFITANLLISDGVEESQAAFSLLTPAHFACTQSQQVSGPEVDGPFQSYSSKIVESIFWGINFLRYDN
eukprot:gene24257-32690_t